MVTAKREMESWQLLQLEPPRLDVAAVGPSMGPETAPVTIVEFSDFECPFCRRAGPVVEELLRRYPQEIRVVYRHLPLEHIHPRARAAAEASACADGQGRFWGFHDRIFEAPDALEDAASQAAAAIAAKPCQSLMMARRLIKGDPAAILARIDAEAECFAERLSSAEAQAAFSAFMQKGKG